MKIMTSYFYQIRNFTPNMIPVSTCVSDPAWFKPKEEDKCCYVDKRGVVCGLRYEPLVVQRNLECICPCLEPAPTRCSFLSNYEKELFKLDKNKILTDFAYCCDFCKKKAHFEGEPIIVLIVYEIPTNPCSERWGLQKFFNCKEFDFHKNL